MLGRLWGMSRGVAVKHDVEHQVKAPTRRSRAVAAKRSTIMAAALEFFSLYGIHGTSLDQVAERADVSKTNLLYYFPSKEDLYIAVLRGLLDVWVAPLIALRAEQHPLTAISEYIRLKLCVSRDDPRLDKRRAYRSR